MTTLPRALRVASTLPRARFHSLATFAGWLVASYVGSVMLWVAVPALALGWQPLVVVSGSMAPVIRPGDLVLVDHQRSEIGPGTIIAFHSSTGEVVLHRVVGNGPDGSYRTRGDANQSPDSGLVPPSAVIGSGRVLVPFGGLPRVWGLGWVFAITGLLVGAALAWRRRPSWAIALLAAVVSMAGMVVASASFSDATSSEGSSLSAVMVAPPSGLTATCGAIGASNVEVELAWTDSATTGITSYQILHDAPGGGTNFSTVGSVDGSTTAFTHSVAVALFGTGTHTYVVRAMVGPWPSVNSNTDAVNIIQVLLVYTCSAL